jgi:hypothetical protein
VVDFSKENSSGSFAGLRSCRWRDAVFFGRLGAGVGLLRTSAPGVLDDMGGEGAEPVRDGFFFARFGGGDFASTPTPGFGSGRSAVATQ